MTHIGFTRTHRVLLLAGTLVLAVLMYLGGAVLVDTNVHPLHAAPLPPTLEETDPAYRMGYLWHPTPIQVETVDSLSNFDFEAFPVEGLSPECSLSDACPPMLSGACNTVVQYDTRNSLTSAWSDYNCLDHNIFPAGSLLFREQGITIPMPQQADLSLAVPLVMSDGLQVMNVFGGLLTECDNDSCIAGSENKARTIYRHAIQPNAATGVYSAVVDSDNMNGFGHVIIACGDPNPGWCASTFTADITCADYTINDTTEGGADNITLYDPRYWISPFAYDGPERVYRVRVTQPRVYTFTLHYSGSPTLPYKNYMSYFLLDATCDQNNVFDNPAPPDNHLAVGEDTYTMTQGMYTLMPGTYYLVVDSMHMPYTGDAFQLDVACQPLGTIYLPLLVRGYPPIPTLTVTPGSGPVGTEFVFTGVDFKPFETVSQWFTNPQGTRYDLPNIIANSQGGFGMTLELTGIWPAGTYTYYALGDESQHTASVNFNLTTSVQASGAKKFHYTER
ncbi:MAG: hypothetical protein JXB35_02355 [Anaerolineae bacterium]|nr:hypothetical protein [Anaerolineae bacterium]